jgi:hypothetical protein
VKRLAVLAIAVLALGGCGLFGKGGDKSPTSTETSNPPTGAASTPASGSPSATASPANVLEFTVDGIGKYQIGANLADLKVDPGVVEDQTGQPPCPTNTTARGAGTLHDIVLSFKPTGDLYLVTNVSTGIPTPSGAYLGTPLVQLKAIYAGVSGTELTAGSSKAFLVTTVSGRGILFYLDSGGTITKMVAGDAAYLKINFQQATKFC